MQSQAIVRPIGVWVLSNNATLNLYDVEAGIDDVAIVGLNDNTQTEECLVHYIDQENPDEARAFIEWGGARYYFDECMKVH